MSAGNINLTSGHTFVVQVLSRMCEMPIQIAAEWPLQEIVSPTTILSGGGRTFHVEYMGKLRWKLIPLPTLARVFVTFVDGQQHPFRMTLRVKIWPSNRTLILWWLFVALGIVGLRWQKTLASEESPMEMVRTVVADWPHLFSLLIIGGAVIAALRAVGWFIALGDATDSD
jgi:hypothetical protein